MRQLAKIDASARKDSIAVQPHLVTEARTHFETQWHSRQRVRKHSFEMDSTVLVGKRKNGTPHEGGVPLSRLGFLVDGSSGAA